MPEQQNIEYKQSWHDDYLKWVCGFANAIGGVIFIGKDDAGNVVHLTDYARLLEEIPNKIRNAMGIICDVQLQDEEEKKYISIKVNPYTVAVSLRGRYYYRSGSTKMELTGVELNEFLLKKAGKTWDDVVEEGATVKDIDDASVAKFIEDSKEKGRMPDTNGLSTFQILEKLKLTEGEKLKRAAIIMFGKDPMRFYPNIQVKIGRFGTDAADRKRPVSHSGTSRNAIKCLGSSYLHGCNDSNAGIRRQAFHLERRSIAIRFEPRRFKIGTQFPSTQPFDSQCLLFCRIY